MGQFTYSKRKANILWFAHFAMRTHGGAQLWSSSSLLDHTKHSSHFPCEIDHSKVFFEGQNMAFSYVSPHEIIYVSRNTRGYSCPF